MFNTVSLIKHEEVTKLAIFTSRVESLSHSPQRHISKLQDPTSAPPSPRSPLEKPLIRMSLSPHEVAQHA